MNTNTKINRDFVNAHEELYAGYEKWFIQADCTLRVTYDSEEEKLVYSYLYDGDLMKGFLMYRESKTLRDFIDYTDSKAHMETISIESDKFLKMAEDFVSSTADWVVSERMVPCNKRNTRDFVVNAVYKYITKRNDSVPARKPILDNIVRKLMASSEAKAYVKNALKERMASEGIGIEEVAAICKENPVGVLKDIFTDKK